MRSQLKNFRRFRQELSYCQQKVSFYSTKLKTLDFESDKVTRLEHLRLLPTTNKQDYRKNFPMGVLAKGYNLKNPQLTQSQSSGTTGERVTTFELGVLLAQRAVACSAIHPVIEQAFTTNEHKICRYAAPNCSDVECANPNSTMADRMLPDGTLVLPVYHDLLTTSAELIERAIDEILQYKPDLYYVDPTHFAFLLRQCQQRGITLPIAPVVSSYSMASAVSKRQIGEFVPLNSHFTELLSSSEMGWMAMTCPEGHMHLNEGSFMFEFLRDGQPIQQGDIGEMCISSIDQGAIPHLRYLTDDWFKVLPGRCPCGCPTTRVQTLGRASQLASTSQSTLSPRTIDNVIQAPIWLDQYQLKQQSKKRFLLQLITNTHYRQDDEQSLHQPLIAKLPKEAKLSIEVVGYIPSDRSGKFQSTQLKKEE